MKSKTVHFTVGEKAKDVTGLLLRPDDARALYVLGHGAGAGMRHAFMETMAALLAARGVATLRYQFPYMEIGRRSPDPPPVLEQTVRDALHKGTELAPDLPLIAGGKSLGGRITSMVAASDPPKELQGLVLLGYPLHAPNKPSTARAKHLSDIKVPMLFLQGTRDSLASLDLLRPIIKKLKLATMHVVEGGDHSFKVPKRSGRTDDEVLEEVARVIQAWVAERVA